MSCLYSNDSLQLSILAVRLHVRRLLKRETQLQTTMVTIRDDLISIIVRHYPIPWHVTMYDKGFAVHRASVISESHLRHHVTVAGIYFISNYSQECFSCCRRFRDVENKLTNYHNKKTYLVWSLYMYQSSWEINILELLYRTYKSSPWTIKTSVKCFDCRLTCPYFQVLA